jgi:hypothetical protein
MNACPPNTNEDEYSWSHLSKVEHDEQQSYKRVCQEQKFIPPKVKIEVSLGHVPCWLIPRALCTLGLWLYKKSKEQCNPHSLLAPKTLKPIPNLSACLSVLNIWGFFPVSLPRVIQPFLQTANMIWLWCISQLEFCHAHIWLLCSLINLRLLDKNMIVEMHIDQGSVEP